MFTEIEIFYRCLAFYAFLCMKSLSSRSIFLLIEPVGFHWWLENEGENECVPDANISLEQFITEVLLLTDTILVVCLRELEKCKKRQ